MDYGCQSFLLSLKRDCQSGLKHGKSAFSSDIESDITIDNVWDEDTYYIYDNITIENGVTLTIQPGTTVFFMGYYHLNVQGTIIAEGTPQEHIIFTRASFVEFMPDSYTGDYWNGIKYIKTSSANVPSHFEYCEFSGSKNIAVFEEPYSGYGGVFFVEEYSDLTIENCIFTQNLANHGGAISCLKNSGIKLINNLANNNFALESASFLRSDYAYPKLLANTITDNVLLNPDVYAVSGAVHSYHSKPLMYNNIVVNNQSNCIDNHQIYLSKPYYTKNNLLEENMVGNLTGNPDFLALPDFFFVPSEMSPCNDSGTLNSEFLSLPDIDIYGNPRIYNTFPDIGCAEFNPVISIYEDENQPLIHKLVTYPNPASRVIEFGFKEKALFSANLTIFDLRGRVVKSIYSSGNNHTIKWDLTDKKNKPVASGIYFYKFCDSSFKTSGRVVVIK
ncbi:MAG: T9SS type A sorting domain-containing protein [Candidatus Cloacimonetes bacterium]|nr:T9SS type A sorting domain-containing protein [Candidatus Cloacimonadota bacterium]